LWDHVLKNYVKNQRSKISCYCPFKSDNLHPWLGGATGYEESSRQQQQQLSQHTHPRIVTKAQIFEKAEGTEVTLKCDPQVEYSFAFLSYKTVFRETTKVYNGGEVLFFFGIRPMREQSVYRLSQEKPAPYNFNFRL